MLFVRIEGMIRFEKIYDLFFYFDFVCLNLKIKLIYIMCLDWEYIEYYINLFLFILIKMNIVFIIIYVYLFVFLWIVVFINVMDKNILNIMISIINNLW